MLEIIIVLILLCVLIWAARALTAAFGIGDPIRTVIYVVLVVLVVLWIVARLGGVDLGLRL